MNGDVLYVYMLERLRQWLGEYGFPLGMGLFAAAVGG